MPVMTRAAAKRAAMGAALDPTGRRQSFENHNKGMVTPTAQKKKHKKKSFGSSPVRLSLSNNKKGQQDAIFQLHLFSPTRDSIIVEEETDNYNDNKENKSAKIMDNNTLEDSKSFDTPKGKKEVPVLTPAKTDETEEEEDVEEEEITFLSPDISSTQVFTDDNSTPLSRFEMVCKYRAGEDDDGDLADFGMELWTVDHFEFIKRLGSGGTANVFMAREKSSGHVVALKVLNQVEEDSLCELDAHQPLSHPHIIKLYDFFYSTKPFGPLSKKQQEKKKRQEEGAEEQEVFLIFILELVHGGNLYDAIRYSDEGRFDELQAAKYFKGALDAMDYVHNVHNLIHCDVKTPNFLLDGDGTIKLADFGAACYSDDAHVVVGSPSYMSPEHLTAWWTSEDGGFDQSSDVYSLGVVLFELLAGYMPYQVIEEDEDLEDYDYLIEGLNGLSITDEDEKESLERKPPMLDLRGLDNGEPLEVPRLVFPTHISEEARSLITNMMDPCMETRMTIGEAQMHPWFKKFCDEE